LQRSQQVSVNWQIPWNRSIITMAHHWLGHGDLARLNLDAAGAALSRQIWAMSGGGPGYLPTTWGDIVPSTLHSHEAHLLILGKPPVDEARLWAARARAMAALGRESDAQTCFREALKANGFMFIKFGKPAPADQPLARCELRRLVGHTSTVHAVAFSPEGRRVLTGAGV